MKTSPLFEPGPEDLDRMIAQYPFALLISAQGSAVCATPLPLILEGDAAGKLEFIGHFSRGNPQVELLRREPRGLAVFMGVNGYISPSWMRDRTQAPTWNYETAHFEIVVSFGTGADETRNALQRLVDVAERSRPNAWSIADMGARYEKLAAAVVPFRAGITAIHGKFKLGQNERLDVLEDTIGGLERESRHELAAAMRRANAGRLGG